MSKSCEVCNAKFLKENPQWMLIDRRKGLPGAWGYLVCGNCGLTSISPTPSEAQLRSYYAEYSNDSNIDFSDGIGSRQPTLRNLFHKLTGDVDPRDFVDARKGARILDYGCGRAAYLRDFHQRGFDISGAEIASSLVQASRQHGFDVRQIDDFSCIPFATAEFDVVYLMQVFEHLREPNVILDELSRILKKEGVLYLALPNFDSIWRKVFKKNWVSGWFAPFHLFHYSRTNLTILARKHGFVVLDCWSKTPESWFRLNLKASLYPSDNKLEVRRSWVDSVPLRYMLMLMLRIFEAPFKERDCLVLKLKKSDKAI